MESTCRLCTKEELRTPAEQQRGVCHTCSRAPGYWQLPPWNRELKPCRCGGRQFVRALAQERGASGSDYVTAYVAPLSVAFRRRGRDGFFRGPRVEVPEAEVSEQIGFLEMLICRQCGLVTWFAQDPSHIPIGPEFGTELLEVPGEPPYR